MVLRHLADDFLDCLSDHIRLDNSKPAGTTYLRCQLVLPCLYRHGCKAYDCEQLGHSGHNLQCDELHQLVLRPRFGKSVVVCLQCRRIFPDVRLLGHVVVLCSETGGSADLSLSTAHGDLRDGSRRWCGDTSMAPASRPEF